MSLRIPKEGYSKVHQEHWSLKYLSRYSQKRCFEWQGQHPLLRSESVHRINEAFSWKQASKTHHWQVATRREIGLLPHCTISHPLLNSRMLIRCRGNLPTKHKWPHPTSATDHNPCILFCFEDPCRGSLLVCFPSGHWKGYSIPLMHSLHLRAPWTSSSCVHPSISKDPRAPENYWLHTALRQATGKLNLCQIVLTNYYKPTVMS